ncbi:hypothetical protein ACI789_13055 [Geodermatophilus sp. SYSU D00965]
MTTVRRTLVLLVLTVAVVVGASLPAQALFADTAAAPAMSLGTLTVQPPTSVKVDTSCLTTTVVTRRTYTSNYWGGSTQTGYSQSTTTQTSRTNVDSTATTRTDGPGWNEYTITTTSKNTELYATASWKPSTSANVSGYQMVAHLGNGDVFTFAQSANATSMSANADADYLSTNLQLTIDTVTTYGWTASSALSKTLTC